MRILMSLLAGLAGATSTYLLLSPDLLFKREGEEAGREARSRFQERVFCHAAKKRGGGGGLGHGSVGGKEKDWPLYRGGEAGQGAWWLFLLDHGGNGEGKTVEKPFSGVLVLTQLFRYNCGNLTCF